MTGAELHAQLAGRKSRGRMLGQPSDLQSCFVSTSEGFTSRKTIEAASAVISSDGRLSDYSEISPLFGFAGLPPWEDSNAHAN
jgi:hypothetical protein